MAGMKYRKLRIARSVAWGIVCLPLIALWVRSYWWYDFHYVVVLDRVVVGGTSDVGMLTLRADEHRSPSFNEKQWDSVSMPQPSVGSIEKDPVRAFACYSIPGAHFIYLPHWSFTLFLAAIAALPWFRLRFSLRTLLVGMTLVAVGLGLVVLAKRY
jgi:hypothetical protein